MTWQGGTETATHGYKFACDGLSRLTDAVYAEGANISTIDDLSLTYEGNQLKKVTDSSPRSAFNGGFEFKDGANAATEYEYDENGNLTKDLNKKITDIQYNYLNLPVLIQFEDGNRISSVYDASGTKLRTTHLIDGVTTTTDYCGNVIYENGVAKTLLTEVGYVSLDDNKYHYFVQDHQGNNRVVVDQNGSVEEVNHYYPFGGLFANSQSVQPYKYNGKELDRKGGLDWYDYGARHYYAALGRWNTIDPMAEKYYSISPYTYCLNSPIRKIDPTGMIPRDYRIDTYGNISPIGKPDNKPDRLVVTNQSTGKDESITINDRSILPALAGKSNIENKAVPLEGKIVRRVSKGKYSVEVIPTMRQGHMAITSSQAEAKNLFVFASKTSNVEWSLSRYKNGDSVVGTLHQNSQAPNFSVLGENYKLENQVYDAHSHTGTNPNVDFVPSTPDINTARNIIKATPNAKVYIYAPWKPGNQWINLNSYAK